MTSAVLQISSPVGLIAAGGVMPFAAYVTGQYPFRTLTTGKRNAFARSDIGWHETIR